MAADIRREELGHGRFVYVTDDYGFGADALYLSRFAAPRADERVCELGTGCGIITLSWFVCPDAPLPRHVDAVELQPDAAALARRAVCENGLEQTVTVVEGDLRDRDLFPSSAQYDRVCVNPPYFSPHSGGEDRCPARQIARREGVGCTLDDVAAAAARWLRPGGRLCLCHRPERWCDVVSVLRAHRLEPKRLQTVHHRPDGPPWLILCEARRDGHPGLVWEPPLTDNSQGG